MVLTRITIMIVILLITLPLQSFGEEEDQIQLNSEAAILIDANSGEVLYDKLGKETMYPASITKIVTAIVAIEEGDLNDTVTISETARNVAGTRVYLEPGEQVKMEQLVKGLLINSGNDAGVAIAEHIDGNVEEFTERMNQFVEEKVGVEDSHFENPHGLYDSNHVTTASDMAKITQYAMQNDVFREIAAIKRMEWKGESWDTTIYNHHRLLRQRDDITGVKNGFVSQSGFTLVTSGSQENIDLIAVTLKASTADEAYQDTEKLLNYGFDNYQTYTVEANPNSYHIGDSEYVLEEDYVFTAAKDLEWTHDVNKDGQLIIKNEQGATVETHKLEEVVQASSLDVNKSLDKETDPNVNQFSLWGTVLGILGLLIVLIIGRMIRKRRKRRFFY